MKPIPRLLVVSLRGLCLAASNGAKAEKAVPYLYDTVRAFNECSIRATGTPTDMAHLCRKANNRKVEQWTGIASKETGKR